MATSLLCLQTRNKISPWNPLYFSLWINPYMTALTNLHKFGGLNNFFFKFFHSSGDLKSQINSTRLTSRYQQGHDPSRQSRRIFLPYHLQLLVAVGIPQLVVASFQSLPLWSHCFPLFCQHEIPCLSSIIRTFMTTFILHLDNPG